MEHYKMSSKPTTRTTTVTTTTTTATRFQRKEKMVALDEEEREILRKFGESSGHQSVRPRMSGTNKVKLNNQVIHEEKVLQVPTKNKLETKKSEDVDESAEKFIQKFKQQLVLQRLESIEKFDKMLARGL